MSPDFPCVTRLLAKASFITTLGATLGCSSSDSDNPTPTPGNDASPDQGTVDQVAPDQVTGNEAAVDQGIPDAANECVGMTYYGPPPCDNDSDCTQYGADYHCDKTAGFQGCGGFVSWPMCIPNVDAGAPDAMPDSCQPAGYYGPQPCENDSECTTQYGDGWYCDKTVGFNDPCSGFVTWPMCMQSVDAGVPDAATDEPMSYYGPMPVDAGPEAMPGYYGPLPY